MSYTELDAWIDEKQLGDWPFDRWDPGALKLRSGVRYFWDYRPYDSIDRLFYRLQQAFGHRDLAILSSTLDAGLTTIRGAIEQSEEDAYASWLDRQVWLPVIDESLNAGDDPAQMLIESIDYVGPPEGFSEQALCAALGLWAIGEWTHANEEKDDLGKTAAICQVGIALAEAEYYRGMSTSEHQRRSNLSKQNKSAAIKRHAHNKAKKSRGREIWLSREWDVQADAERAIATDCNITKDVAGRWVREFKRAHR